MASEILIASEGKFLVPTLIPLVDKEDKQDQLYSPLHPLVQDLDGQERVKHMVSCFQTHKSPCEIQTLTEIGELPLQSATISLNTRGASPYKAYFITPADNFQGSELDEYMHSIA